jgi:hypothetical protein
MNRNSKRLIAIGTPIAAVAISGVAFAAWTATGTGSGAATAASNIDATVTATSTADGALWPGNSVGVPVHFTVNNPNPYDVHFGTFSNATINAVTPGAGTGTCGTSDFSLTATSGNLASSVAAAAGSTGNAGATAAILKMAHTAADACQGAVVTVTMKVAGTQD